MGIARRNIPSTSALGGRRASFISFSSAVETLISFGLTLRRGYASANSRLSRMRALLAWWWMLRSRRYTVLRDLAIQLPDTVIHVGLLVVSTRGVFVVETVETDSRPKAVSKTEHEPAGPVARAPDELVRHYEEQARRIAHAIDESSSFVSPVLVLDDAGALPAERPAYLVNAPGVVDYIRSFRVEVLSRRRTQQIVSHLAHSTSPALPKAA